MMSSFSDLSFKVFLAVFLISFLGFKVNALDSQKARDGKLLSLFQVVTFANDGCIGAGRNGTCFTLDECNAKGGINVGSCAQGFGICCAFTIGCGASSRENCTYIESNSPNVGECRHLICPCNDNICQLRLDFDTFVIAGPSTNTNSETRILAGDVNSGGHPNTLASQCLTDTFSVTNSAGRNPAPICGINSGQHMYVDVDRSRGGDGCNGLDFQLGNTAIFTTIPDRRWSIKVSQIECDSPWKAPNGCTQYFLDNADIVQTYNFDGGQHIAYQEQTICVRRNRGQCRICWSAVTPEDFSLSGIYKSTPGLGRGYTKQSVCCGYDAMGKNIRGYDCLQIPGAKRRDNGEFVPNSRICGRSVGLVAAGVVGNTVRTSADITICSTQQPFQIQFISDGFEEYVREAKNPNKGFRLAYSQDSQC